MSRYLRGGNVKTTSQNKFKMGFLIIVVVIVLFAVRFVGVLNKYSERGGYFFVQLLNFSMPVVETHGFDKGAFVENQISVKKVLGETLGLGNISTFGIIGSEISLYNNPVVNDGNSKSNIFSFLKPFQLNEDSIVKLTDEEIAQLNQVSPAYNPNLKKTLDSSKPEVLIYHTHTTEGYSVGNGRYDTTNEDLNVVGVGDVLAKELEENYGISVIHDKTIHNSSYNESYINSGETVQSYLDQYGDFKLIIDLHRDSAAKELCSVNINNQDLARIMYVTAQNSPRYEVNRALADEFAAKTQALFPGLLRNSPIYEYDSGQHYGFNLGLSDNVLLIEDGSTTNTAQEARLSGKYIARLVAEHINGQN